MSTTAPTFENRVRGAVLGAAIGDALGHPTEFISSFEALAARSLATRNDARHYVDEANPETLNEPKERGLWRYQGDEAK